MNAAQETRQERLDRGARMYALADRSDPFTLARAQTHIRVGLCDASGRTGEKEPRYDATPRSVTRTLPDGLCFSNGSHEYNAVEYGQRIRP